MKYKKWMLLLLQSHSLSSYLVVILVLSSLTTFSSSSTVLTRVKVSSESKPSSIRMEEVNEPVEIEIPPQTCR